MADETQQPDPFADHPLVAIARVGLDIEKELAGSTTWITIREAAKVHEHEWTERLIATPAGDIDEIIACKINIYAVRAMEGFIADAVSRGKEAIEKLETMETPDDE